jgi:hypothetical protein
LQRPGYQVAPTVIAALRAGRTFLVDADFLQRWAAKSRCCFGPDFSTTGTGTTLCSWHFRQFGADLDFGVDPDSAGTVGYFKHVLELPLISSGSIRDSFDDFKRRRVFDLGGETIQSRQLAAQNGPLRCGSFPNAPHCRISDQDRALLRL